MFLFLFVVIKGAFRGREKNGGCGLVELRVGRGAG